MSKEVTENDKDELVTGACDIELELGVNVEVSCDVCTYLNEISLVAA